MDGVQKKTITLLIVLEEQFMMEKSFDVEENQLDFDICMCFGLKKLWTWRFWCLFLVHAVRPKSHHQLLFFLLNNQVFPKNLLKGLSIFIFSSFL
jgi:hypothetical protein